MILNSSVIHQDNTNDKLARKLLKYAKYRAKKYSLDFDLVLADITIPDKCPILGIQLVENPVHSNSNSPSIDRIDSSKGYLKGNIQVISHKANTMKSNASLEELTLFALWVLGRSPID